MGSNELYTFAEQNLYSMNKYFLKIDSPKGQLFESSKQPKEGFVKTETTNPQGETVVSYRRYLPDGAYGRLTSISERTVEFSGRKIRSINVILVDGEDRYYIDVPLFNAKKSIAKYAESLIRVMPVLVKDQAYRFYPYNFENKEKTNKDGTYQRNIGISVAIAKLSPKLYDNINKLPLLTYASWDKDKNEEIPGDIPLLVREEDIDGTLVFNSKKKDKYLYDTMVKHSIAWESAGGGRANTFNSKEEQQDEPVQNAMQAARGQGFEAPKTEAAPVEEFAGDDDDSDLPF